MIWISFILSVFWAVWLILTKGLNGSASRTMLLGGIAFTLVLPLIHTTCTFLEFGWSYDKATTSGPSASALMKAISIIWCMGSSLAFLVLAKQSFAAKALRKNSRPLTRKTAKQIADVCGLSSDYLHARLRISDGLTSPCVVGVRRSMIIVPVSSSNWSPQTWRCILAHEKQHIAGGDIAWRYAIAAVRILWWFHPLAHLLAKRAEMACEETCDDAVLANGVDSRSYAETLIQLASSRNNSTTAIAALTGSRGQAITARLTRIMQQPAKSRLPVFISLSALIILLTCIAASARVSIDQNSIPENPLNTESLTRLAADPFPAD